MLSIWTVCKHINVIYSSLRKQSRVRKRKTLGVPCSSIMLAFISIMPESNCPSIRAFWIRRSRMLTNNSKSLYWVKYWLLLVHTSVLSHPNLTNEPPTYFGSQEEGLKVDWETGQHRAYLNQLCAQKAFHYLSHYLKKRNLMEITKALYLLLQTLFFIGDYIYLLAWYFHQNVKYPVISFR